MTMRARSLELNLVNTEAVGAADIDGRNRALRALDLLPTGGRGPHAPNISPEHAAYMLLGLGSASVAADAGRAAKRYASFVNPAAPKAGTLLIYLTDLLSHPDAANKIEEVRMCRTHPWVMIVAADGQRVIYRPIRTGRESDDGQRCLSTQHYSKADANEIRGRASLRTFD